MSKRQELRQLEALLVEQTAKVESMREAAKAEQELEEFVRAEAQEKGIDLVAFALLIAPSLARGYSAPVSKVSSGERKTRKPRELKVYINPNTNERVETKGGNHSVLKAWKAEHGGETVESWLHS